MAGRSPKCPSCSRGAAGAQGQKVTGWPHWSQLPVACSQALDRQATVGSLGSSLASTVTSTARLLGAAAGSHAQNTAVCERERCQVGPKDVCWPMHSCRNTAIKA